MQPEFSWILKLHSFCWVNSTPKRHTSWECIVEHMDILLFMCWTDSEELCFLPQVYSMMLKEDVQSDLEWDQWCQVLCVLLNVALTVGGYFWKPDAAESISVSVCETGALTSHLIGYTWCVWPLCCRYWAGVWWDRVNHAQWIWVLGFI